MEISLTVFSIFVFALGAALFVLTSSESTALAQEEDQTPACL